MSATLCFLGAVALAAEVSGTVVDDAGDPIAGVTVYAIDARLGYAADTSASDGTFAIAGLPDNPYRVLARPPETVDHPDQYYPSGWEYCDGRPFDLGDEPVSGLSLALPPGGHMTGQVLDPDGLPVVGAQVQVEGVDSIAKVMRNGAETDADGEFEIVGLSTDSVVASRYRLEIDASGLPEQYAGQVYDGDDAPDWDVLRTETTDVGSLTLLPGISVSGALTGPDGPVSGAAVHVYSGGQVQSVVSAADGSYAASGLPPGDVITWASLAGYGLTYYPDADRPGESVPAGEERTALTDVDLTLPWESRLVGQLEGDLDDWSGGSVLVYNDSYTVGIGGTVGLDGSFSVGRLHGGDYRVYLYLEDEGFLDDYLRESDGERRTLVVPEEGSSETLFVAPVVAATLEGDVVDDAGNPVYGAVIYADPGDADVQAQAAVSDHDGHYLLEGLSALPYTVEVYVTAYCAEDDGYVRTWWPGEVDEARATTLLPDAGERLVGLDFELPFDGDHDGMGDAWESAVGLDTTRDDSAEDPDGDGYDNLAEYLLGTDPNSEAEAGCRGCSTSTRPASGLWLLVGLLGWRRRP